MILLQAVADGRLGGGTTHVLQLIAAIRAELPVEVHLVSQAGSPALAEAARLGASVHGFDFFRARLDPRLWLRLRGLVRRLRPALIHAHGARAGLALSRVAPPSPLIYSVHGYHFVAKPFALRKLALLSEQVCCGRAALTLFVCRHDRDLAAATGILGPDQRHRVIHNGIAADLPQAVGSPDGRCLGFLGRLVEQKNPLLLVDVLDVLRAEDYRLVVIGDGPLLEPLRQRAEALALSDRVELLGSLPRAAALMRLRSVDVLLLPSLWEGLPFTPLEAMAMGIPVVASAVGGLTEMVEDGVSGILIRGADPADYARAVRQLAAAPALRTAIIDQARQAVAERFSLSAAQRAHLDLYRAALSLPEPALIPA